MRFDLVIFDCDGVLIDSEMLSVQADIECLAEYGIELPAGEILDRYTGLSMASMRNDIEARFRRPLPEFADRHQTRLRALFEAGLRAMPGAIAVLDWLTCRSCVASSSTPERLAHALSLVGLFDRWSRPSMRCKSGWSLRWPKVRPPWVEVWPDRRRSAAV